MLKMLKITSKLVKKKIYYFKNNNEKEFNNSIFKYICVKYKIK